MKHINHPDTHAVTMHKDRRSHAGRPDAGHVIPFPAEPAPYPHATGSTYLEAPFRRLMEPVLHRARAASAFAGCMVLELEGSQEIEETFGEELAGALAAAVEFRLLESLRCVDVVHPLESNEFLILIDCLEDECGAGDIAGRLLEQCDAPFDIAGMRLTLQGRIGMALYPTDAVDPGTLLRCACVARREAALEGSDCHYFAPDPHCGAYRCGE